ncbi:MAG TPA: hypothetical protein PLO23_09215 [Alphaproteobacteria bacterium]|nr:hypothetical protein [Alphaproteobacteria bacterium]
MSRNTVLSMVPDLKEAFAMENLRPLKTEEMVKAPNILIGKGHDARAVDEFLSAYQRAMSLE